MFLLTACTLKLILYWKLFLKYLTIIDLVLPSIISKITILVYFAKVISKTSHLENKPSWKQAILKTSHLEKKSYWKQAIVKTSPSRKKAHPWTLKSKKSMSLFSTFYGILKSNKVKKLYILLFSFGNENYYNIEIRVLTEHWDPVPFISF